MMKKIITIDAIMAAFVGAIGYGAGYAIPNKYGYSTIICFVCCMILGMILDKIANIIIFNRFVQKSEKLKHFVFGGIVMLFVIALIAVKVLFDYSLLGELTGNVSFVVVVPVIAFVFSYCVRYIKRFKLSMKYGSGEDGFTFDKSATKQLKTLTGKNRILKEYSGTDPVAKAVSGNYIGEKEKDFVRFLGITYAHANRWERASYVKDSSDFIEAYYLGNSSIQPDSSHNILTGFDQDEDCLNLNIWTSKHTPNANKPVLVYFHGGDGRYGGIANPLYHLENIAKGIPNAVFVSVNYRLGVFGVVDFSSSDIVGKEEYQDSASLSLLDQVEALKWIKENIYAFGGDPRNITVAGDSSGGSDILLLSAMKEAKGLFKRAFIICASSADTPKNNDVAAFLGEKLIEEFNIKSVSDLKNLTSEQLKDFSVKNYELLELPPRNGRFVPEDVKKEYLSGVASDIEFIFGIAADDLTAWQAMLAGEVSLDAMSENYFELFKSRIKEENLGQLDDIINKYKQSGLNDLAAKQAIMADYQFKVSSLHDCSALARGGSKVRCFYWDVTGEVEKLKANAVSVITAILGNTDIAEQMGYLHEKHVTKIMQSLVRKYMNRQSPQLFNNEINGVSEIIWDEFDPDNGGVLHIQKDSIKMESYPFSETVRELDMITE